MDVNNLPLDRWVPGPYAPQHAEADVRMRPRPILHSRDSGQVPHMTNVVEMVDADYSARDTLSELAGSFAPKSRSPRSVCSADRGESKESEAGEGSVKRGVVARAGHSVYVAVVVEGWVCGLSVVEEPKAAEHAVETRIHWQLEASPGAGVRTMAGEGAVKCSVPQYRYRILAKFHTASRPVADPHMEQRVAQLGS